MFVNAVSCRPEIIASGNDLLRQHQVGGEIVLSPKVESLSNVTQHLILTLIAEFDDWNPRVDTRCFHDFGSVQVLGEYYYFLIETLQAQQRTLARIMRVMHSSEYEDNMN